MTPRSSSAKRALALLGCLAATALAAPLHAGDPPPSPAGPRAPGTAADAQVSATAEALFEQGLDLIKAKKYAEACPKLKESLRIDPAIGTLLYLADCYEKNGQTASAWATFSDAVAATHNAGQSDREVKATQRVQKLASKLVKLTLTMAPENAAVADLEIKRDGLVIGAALLGTPIPVDPGDHPIEVSAPGKKPWSGVATVPSKAGSVVAFVIPTLEDLPPPPPPEVVPTAVVEPPPPPPPTATAIIAPPPRRDEPPPPPDTTMRTAGLVIGGVGIVGVVVGSALGITAKGQNDDALARYCDGQFCSDPRGIEPTTSAKSFALGSTVAFAVGGAAVAAGAGMLIYSVVSKPAPAAGTRPTPPASAHLRLGPGGFTLTGRF